MIIGYARVSTLEQSSDMQIDALKKAGCEKIYQEKVSGVKDDRVELQRALDTLRSGDTFVVFKLDRLARSTKKLLEISEHLEQLNVELVSIQDKIDTTTPVGKAMFRMLAVISELERDIIRERTLEGIKAARARGRKGGRPRIDAKRLQKAMTMYKSKQFSLREIQEATNISTATLYRALKSEYITGI